MLHVWFYICVLLSGLDTSKSWNIKSMWEIVISAGIISFHITMVKPYDERANYLVRKFKLSYPSLYSHFSFRLMLEGFKILNSKQKKERRKKETKQLKDFQLIQKKTE